MDPLAGVRCCGGGCGTGGGAITIVGILTLFSLLGVGSVGLGGWTFSGIAALGANLGCNLGGAISLGAILT